VCACPACLKNIFEYFCEGRKYSKGTRKIGVKRGRRSQNLNAATRIDCGVSMAGSEQRMSIFDPSRERSLSHLPLGSVHPTKHFASSRSLQTASLVNLASTLHFGCDHRNNAAVRFGGFLVRIGVVQRRECNGSCRLGSLGVGVA
jgi:hypothetical protein